VPELILARLAAVRVLFRGRRDIAIEILALRQQVAVLKRKRAFCGCYSGKLESPW